jgi:glycosyltransferase involved in cell wall biosynthesis
VNKIKILFIDWSLWNYDCLSPYESPSGGTQSAVAYLSASLVAAGHDIAVINGVPEKRIVCGVEFNCFPQDATWMNSFDIVVSVTSLKAELLRTSGCTRPIVAWCHHDVNQDAVAPLHKPETHALYAGFALVSDWQRAEYASTFGLSDTLMRTLRNAVSPAMLRHGLSMSWLDSGTPPILAYSSTPFRGLDVLLLAFPMIRKAIPGASLRIFSGMGIYGDNETDKSFQSLYEISKVLPGVEYVGPLGQLQLSKEIASADMLAYPSTFRETSCIAVMEAAAAGLYIVSTDLGALTETTRGYADLICAPNPTERGNLALFATRYAQSFVESYQKALSDPSATRLKLEKQATEFRLQSSWAVRAVEWASWLKTMI